MIGPITTADHYKIMQTPLFCVIFDDDRLNCEGFSRSKLLKFLELNLLGSERPKHLKLAEQGGFEPPVRVYPVRQFSKLLV